MKECRFVQYGNTVKAIGSYRGKTVTATAKCDPKDEFDFEVGKDLAEARLNEKIRQKRIKNCNRRIVELGNEMNSLTNKWNELHNKQARTKKYLKELSSQ